MDVYKKMFFLLLLIFIGIGSYAQKYFNNLYDNNTNIEGFNDVVQTVDSGYLTVGTSKIFSVGYDYYALRTDKYGNKINETFIVIPKTEIILGSINSISDSLFISTGLIIDQDSTTLRYNRDVLLVKMKITGDTIWTKRFRKGIGTSSNPDFETGKVAIVSNDGGFVIAGYTSYSAGLGYQIYVIKTDNLGNLLWEQTYGGTNSDDVYDIIETPDKGFLLAGYTYSYGNGGRDGYLIKIDSLGNFEWQKTYGGGGNDGLCGINRCIDGSGYLLSGWYNFDLSNSMYDKPQLIKVNNSGVVIWDKKYGGNKVSGYLLSAVQLADSSIIMCGGINDTLGMPNSGLLLKTNKTGDSLWAREYKRATTNDDYFYNFSPTFDGGYIITGTASGQATPTGTQDGWLIKTDCMGADSITYYFGDTCYINPIGIKEIQHSETEIIIYPNPVYEVLTIELPAQNEEGFIEIENMLGQKVYEAKINNKLNTIHLKQLESGIYLIKVFNKGQFIETKKFVKE